MRGRFIAQGAVPVLPSDDEDALSARILAMEHRLTRWRCGWWRPGAARLDGARVTYAPDAPAPYLWQA